MKIVFLVYEMAYGGIPRLVFNEATALKSCGHSVKILTTRLNKDHKMPEADDIEMTCFGDFIPVHFPGGCYWRMMVLALYLRFWTGWDYDVVFVDQLPECIPVLKKFINYSVKVIFFCHYPQKLLVPRDNIFDRLLNTAIDVLEEWSISLADCILCNSQFTKSKFCESYSNQSILTLPIYVMNPSISDKLFDGKAPVISSNVIPTHGQKSFFLLFSRFDPVKKFELAINALAILKKHTSRNRFNSVHLVIAGGINEDQQKYLAKLKALTATHQLTDHVTFVTSLTEDEKHSLFVNCSALLQTCDFEHYGIVPVEGMWAGKPVIAVAACGFLETVRHRETGLLVLPNDPEALAKAMLEAVNNPETFKNYGKEGRKVAEKKYSFSVFRNQLINVLQHVTKDRDL